MHGTLLYRIASFKIHKYLCKGNLATNHQINIVQFPPIFKAIQQLHITIMHTFFLHLYYTYFDYELLEFIVRQKSGLVVRGRVGIATEVLHVIDGHL